MYELNETLASVKKERKRLGKSCITFDVCCDFCNTEQVKNSSGLERNLLYPLCFFILLAMTVQWNCFNILVYLNTVDATGHITYAC